MKINYILCRHCGRPWLPSEEVNAKQAFCTNCSIERREFSEKIFMSHKRDVIQSGSYVFLSSPPYDKNSEPSCEEWHLTNKFSGRKKPRR